MTMHNVQAGGASIPSLGFGTWAARGDECAQAVTWALESGYRHIDTAAVYANEEAVGEGIRASRVNLRISGNGRLNAGWLLDGFDITECELGSTSITPSTDALEEFKVLAGGMSAE